MGKRSSRVLVAKVAFVVGGGDLEKKMYAKLKVGAERSGLERLVRNEYSPPFDELCRFGSWTIKLAQAAALT